MGGGLTKSGYSILVEAFVCGFVEQNVFELDENKGEKGDDEDGARDNIQGGE